MTPKVFAPDFGMNEQGWYKFPADADYRRAIFTAEAMEHPARMNLHLLASIIDYVSEPGESLMDIMAGSGSIMIGALVDRRIICIETSPKYYNLILEQAEHIKLLKPDANTFCILGDCLKVMPVPTNHIVFSPPYSAIMKKKKFTAGDISQEVIGSGLLDYSAGDGNVGMLNRFFYNQTMEKIYAKCFDSINEGGTLTIVIKDYIEKQKRIYLSDWVIRSCVRLGFEQLDWFKWAAPGTFFLNLYRKRGWNTVDDEDVIILRKPKKEVVSELGILRQTTTFPVLVGAASA